MIKIIAIILCSVFAFVLFVRTLEHTSIFFPTRSITFTPQDINLAFEDIIFPSHGLSLNGWLIKAPNARSTLLFFHGNAGNLSHRLEKIQMFHRMSLNVFIIDYRGYGKSQGRPSEQGLYQDALSAYDYLASRSDIDQNNIIVYGASLGSVVAIDCATKRKMACLIVDSAFSSAADISRRIYPFIPVWLLRTKMDSVSKIQSIFVPKLFIHSRDDEIVPIELGRRLFDQAPLPKKFIEIRGGHNTGYGESEKEFTQGIQSFLEELNLLNEANIYGV
ncbi:MAG: alpha/beta hydrolase [Candidatus Omnitrophota bacterium]